MNRLFLTLITCLLAFVLAGCFKVRHEKLSGEQFLYDKTVMQYTKYNEKILSRIAIDEINCDLHAEHTGNFVFSMIEIVGLEKVIAHAKSDYAKQQVRLYESSRFSKSR